MSLSISGGVMFGGWSGAAGRVDENDIQVIRSNSKCHIWKFGLMRLVLLLGGGCWYLHVVYPLQGRGCVQRDGW